MSDKERVLELLKDGPLRGRVLRAALNDGRWCWQRYSGVQFYFFMDTVLEVELYYVHRIVGSDCVHISMFRRKDRS